MTVIGIFLLLIALMLLGLPIAAALGGTAIIVMLLTGGPDLLVIFAQRIYSPVISFPLLAVPFFILAGNLMNAGGMTQRIFGVAELIVGRIPGGLGHVSVISSMIFAGMSGSAVADAAGLGVVQIHALKKAGYSARFAAMITAVSSTIAPIIPPSIPFIVYGALAQVSVGALFLAGVVPGIAMGLSLMIVVALVARRRAFPLSDPRPPLPQTIRLFLGAAPALLMPIVIIGVILTGITTPTEAAVIASIYSLAVGTLFYRDLRFVDVPAVIWESARQTAQILFIVGTAGAFGWILVQQQIPNAIIQATLALTTEPWIILLLINFVLLVLGMFIEGLAILIIVMPIFLPLIKTIGIDPVQFGVMISLNIAIGLLTPPVGLCLYIVSAISGASVGEIVSESWPYLAALIFVLGLVTFVPEVSMFLPRAFGF